MLYKVFTVFAASLIVFIFTNSLLSLFYKKYLSRDRQAAVATGIVAIIFVSLPLSFVTNIPVAILAGVAAQLILFHQFRRHAKNILVEQAIQDIHFTAAWARRYVKNIKGSGCKQAEEEGGTNDSCNSVKFSDYSSPLSSISDAMNFDIVRDGFLLGKLSEARNNSIYKVYADSGIIEEDIPEGSSPDAGAASLLMKAGIAYSGGFEDIMSITLGDVEESLKAVLGGNKGKLSISKSCLRIDREITELSKRLSVIGFEEHVNYVLGLRRLAVSAIEAMRGGDGAE